MRSWPLQNPTFRPAAPVHMLRKVRAVLPRVHAEQGTGAAARARAQGALHSASRIERHAMPGCRDPATATGRAGWGAARLPRVGAEQGGPEARGRQVRDHGGQVVARGGRARRAAAAAVPGRPRGQERGLEALQHVQLLLQPARPPRPAAHQHIVRNNIVRRHDMHRCRTGGQSTAVVTAHDSLSRWPAGTAAQQHIRSVIRPTQSAGREGGSADAAARPRVPRAPWAGSGVSRSAFPAIMHCGPSTMTS